MNGSGSPTLDEAFELATRGDYAGALALCDRFDKEHPGDRRGLRERAAILLHKREYAAAEAALHQLVRGGGSAEPCDLFDYGRVLAMQGRHRDAVLALTRCIDISVQHSDEYYVSSAKLVRAFSQVEMRNFIAAISDLDHLPDDTKFWIGNHGLVTKTSLAAIIAAKNAG